MGALSGAINGAAAGSALGPWGIGLIIICGNITKTSLCSPKKNGRPQWVKAHSGRNRRNEKEGGFCPVYFPADRNRQKLIPVIL